MADAYELSVTLFQPYSEADTPPPFMLIWRESRLRRASTPYREQAVMVTIRRLHIVLTTTLRVYNTPYSTLRRLRQHLRWCLLRAATRQRQRPRNSTTPSHRRRAHTLRRRRFAGFPLPPRWRHTYAPLR